MIIKEDGVYLVNAKLLISIAEIVSELELMNKDNKSFNNDRLLYKLGVLSGLFNSKNFSEVIEDGEK